MRNKLTKIVLLIDETYLQKEVQFQGGEMTGCDNNGELFKSIMMFMIVGMRNNVSFGVKAILETKTKEKWMSYK